MSRARGAMLRCSVGAVRRFRATGSTLQQEFCRKCLGVDAPELFPHNPPTCMKLLFVADLHYALKQFDWLVANAANFNPIVIGGDLLDLASSLDFDVQIVVVEKYLGLIRQKTRLLVSSGNHDGDSRSAADESVAQWIQESRADGLFVDGDS